MSSVQSPEADAGHAARVNTLIERSLAEARAAKDEAQMQRSFEAYQSTLQHLMQRSLCAHGVLVAAAG